MNYRAAVATIMSSIGGGATAIVISFAKTKKLQVSDCILSTIFEKILSLADILPILFGDVFRDRFVLGGF